MTLLDYYTAGTVEYFTILFTILFGILSLLILARDGRYGTHLKILTFLYSLTVLATAWVTARIIGTTYLIRYELQQLGYFTNYTSQASVYDPLGVTRFLSATPPQYYGLLYYGVPMVIAAGMIVFWYIGVIRDTNRAPRSKR